MARWMWECADLWASNSDKLHWGRHQRRLWYRIHQINTAADTAQTLSEGGGTGEREIEELPERSMVWMCLPPSWVPTFTPQYLAMCEWDRWIHRHTKTGTSTHTHKRDHQQGLAGQTDIWHWSPSPPIPSPAAASPIPIPSPHWPFHPPRPASFVHPCWLADSTEHCSEVKTGQAPQTLH